MTEVGPEEQSRSEGTTSAAVLDPEFRRIFLEHFAFVCRSLQRLGVREADVEDVSQELFLAALRAFGEWDRSRPIKPWLFGFAFRFAANYRRLGWHRGRTLEDSPVSPKVHDKLAAKITVSRALETLDDDKRAVLVMHDLEGMSAPEIGEALGIPLNTVYSRVRLARDAFRSAVKSTEEVAR
ncbi:MAG: RNA polymerase sigma factor [Deltaproteobacteria bacterium]|nr:RNA polymerase sigma factor [Deltaproteobacteria bacterium]